MTEKTGTDHAFRRLRLAGAILALALGAGLVALFALSEPPEKVQDTRGCNFSTCGPLEFGDCNTVLDGPLHVYTRLPRRYLEDCSHWRSGSAFCKAATAVRSYCSPDADTSLPGRR